ncbi:hypothetical protein GUJ93_ZPchr0015g6823 [Zizania palustris]|uniref:Uncharacterized protein n=1 Tax=Zizania palustris TaxID=103762 RepID=A0A8J5SYR4_ZIZPA|nr:hypothetical protein GUJ93_ZPchr0015g6823 [Zizania palustris]
MSCWEEMSPRDAKLVEGLNKDNIRRTSAINQYSLNFCSCNISSDNKKGSSSGDGKNHSFASVLSILLLRRWHNTGHRRLPWRFEAVYTYNNLLRLRTCLERVSVSSASTRALFEIAKVYERENSPGSSSPEYLQSFEVSNLGSKRTFCKSGCSRDFRRILPEFQAPAWLQVSPSSARYADSQSSSKLKKSYSPSLHYRIATREAAGSAVRLPLPGCRRHFDKMRRPPDTAQTITILSPSGLDWVLPTYGCPPKPLVRSKAGLRRPAGRFPGKPLRHALEPPEA